MSSVTQELQMLRDAAARVVSDATAGGLPEHRDADAPVWSSAMELGWLMLPFEEADGGLAGGAPEICALAEELGRSLLVGSYLVGTILPGRIASAAPPGAVRTRIIDDLMAGTRTLSVADAEPQSRGMCSDVATRATESSGEWILDGAKTNVWSCAETQMLLVSAAVAGDEPRELFLTVPVPSPGLDIREYATIDGGRALDCEFKRVALKADAVLVPPGTNVRELRESAWDLTLVAVAAECVGMMKSLIERTAEHLRTRKQFNQPLATFQALRHRMADMALASRRADALGALVAQQFASLDANDRARLASACGVKALAGARYVCEQAVQLHGGMGMSAEVPVGRYLRRILALEATFGSPEHLRARFQAHGDETLV